MSGMKTAISVILALAFVGGLLYFLGSQKPVVTASVPKPKPAPTEVPAPAVRGCAQKTPEPHAGHPHSADCAAWSAVAPGCA